MRRTASLFVAITLLGFSSPLLARDIYVSNVRGDDRLSGQRNERASVEEGPVRTIGRALALAAAGDRIVLHNAGVPYHESISLVGSRHSGTSSVRFQLIGNGAVLDGSAPVPADAWEHYRENVYRFRPRQLVHQQLFLDGKPLMRVVSEPLGAPQAELQPLEWTLHGGFIYFRTQPMRLPEDYTLSHTALPVGITLLHVRCVAIRDLVVQGFQIDGISAFNSAVDVQLEHVTVRGNARSGIAVGGASRVGVNACLVGDNGRAQLLALPLSETFVRGSELIANTAPAVVNQGGRVYIDGVPAGESAAEMPKELAAARHW
jgi:hypothetical protein